MNAQEFIQKWRYSINYLNRPSVGIHVGWELISPSSQVKTVTSKEAWKILQKCIPPWFKSPQTFSDLSKSKNSDYKQILGEETDNGKIDYYRKNGLKEPYFCIFANHDGSTMLLGDGNHRLFDCLYLINNDHQNIENDIKNTVVDIIYLENFVDVLRTDLIWPKNP